MIPPVRRYGDIECESFEDYYARWPQALAAIPECVVKDWIYRHWRDFQEHWEALRPEAWLWERRTYTTEEVMSVDHIGTWIRELDAEGVEFVGTAPRSQTRLAQYMRSHGTFPVPIIVARNSGHVTHPRSADEKMKQPLQLIEGHSRLACLRGLVNSGWPTLATGHLVWEARIPPATSGA
jgi:hypothetical protein